MNLTIVDGVVALVVLISAVLAYNRGLTREVLAIAGWVIAGLAAFYFAPLVEPLVLEIPYVGDFLSPSCLLTALAAFAIVFALALIVVSIFTPVLAGAVQSTPLRAIDSGLGFLFGVARGVLLVAVLYLLYDLAVPLEERIEAVDRSASLELISETADLAQRTAPEEMPPWLAARIDRLTGDCGAGAETDTQARAGLPPLGVTAG